MTSWASFIHKDILGWVGEKSHKSQTGEMVPVLTGTDLLPSPQGHKVSLLMHAVKGNLANTVCKRKHQHIASVPVFGGPCMLFSNFDSFFFFFAVPCRGWGRGERWIFLLVPLPHSAPAAWCHPDPKSRGGNSGDRAVCFLAHQAKPSHAPEMGGGGANVYTHSALGGASLPQGHLEASLVLKHPPFVCRHAAPQKLCRRHRRRRR